MIQKGFLTQGRKGSSDNHFASLLGKSLFYIAVIILIAAPIYMMAHLARADSIITVWTPFMVAGVSFVFVSLLIRLAGKKEPVTRKPFKIRMT